MRRIGHAVCCTVFATSASAIPVFHSSFSGGPQGNTYAVYLDRGVAWVDADEFADSLGPNAHLATLTSAEEDLFVFNHTTSLAFQAWIGGSQPVGELNRDANWSWVNGEGTISGTNAEPGYANWLPWESNDFYGAGSEQHLAIGLFGLFGWNDVGNASNVGGFVVEYESVPDAGATILLLSASLVGLLSARRRIHA